MSNSRSSSVIHGAIMLVMIAALVLVLGGLPGSVSAAPTCTTNCYVSPSGDDNNAGDAANPLKTIGAAVTQVSPGGTVHVAAGTYAETVLVNKWLVLTGAGSGSDPAMNTIIAPPTGMGIDLRGSGLSTTQRLVISDLRVTSVNSLGIKVVSGGGSYTTLDNVASVGNKIHGLEFQLPIAQLAQDFEVLDSDLSNNTGTGLRFASTSPMDGLKVENTNLNSNAIGLTVYSNVGKPAFDNIAFTNVSLSNNILYGAYVERMDNASFDGITVTGNNNNGTAASGYGFIAYLKYDAFSNVSFTNSTFGGNASGSCCTDLSFGRTDGGSLANLTISHNEFSGTSPYGIYLPSSGYDISTTHINRNSFTGNHLYGAVYVPGPTSTNFDATCNWWGASDGPSGAGTGSGSKVSAYVNYGSRLLSDDLDGPCSATLTVTAPDDLVCEQPVEMTIDFSDVVDLYGYQFEVTYDHTKATANGAFVNSWFDTTAPSMVPPGWNAYCNAGTCKFAASLQNPDPAVSTVTPETVAKITFTRAAAGSFTASVGNVVLTNLDGDSMPVTLDDADFDFDVCGMASVSGKVSLQGRGTPGNPGWVKLIDTSAVDPFPAISVPFDAAGNYSVPNIPVMSGGSNYVIQATHYLYLGNEKALPLSPGDALTGQNTRLLGGDANNSGVFDNPGNLMGPGVAVGVSIADVGCIGSDFAGAPNECGTAGDTYYADSSTDINNDGIVNIQDLSIAGGNFDKDPFLSW